MPAKAEEAYGVPKVLRPYLDKYLRIGYAPLIAIATVREEFRLDPLKADLTVLLDTVSTNRRAFQRQVQTRKTDLKNIAVPGLVDCRRGLEDFLQQYKLLSKEHFDSIEDLDRMLVLSQQHPESIFGASSATPLDDEQSYLAEGFIFSSKNFLNNLKLLHDVMGSEITLLVDGTFKITCDGWVLIVVGTHSVTIDERGLHHTVRPIMFCWTYSENAAAMKVIVSCIHNTAKELFGLPAIHIAVASIDRSDAFYNGLTLDSTNDTSIVNCFAHMFRKVDTNEGLRITSKQAKSAILEDIKLLSKAPSPEAFHIGLGLALARWKDELKQEVFVKYFREYYTGRWDGWYVSATKLREIGVTTNPMESLNKIIKEVCPHSYTAHVAVTDKFHFLLRALTEKHGIVGAPILRNTMGRQLELIKTENSIPKDVLLKAVNLVTTTRPKQWLIHTDGMIYFNSKKSVELPVTVERVERFKSLLAGESETPHTWASYSEDVSLYQVRVVGVQGDSEPRFVCPCKNAMHNGFLCAHSLAARHLHLTKTINLISMSEPFKIVKKRGRKKTTKGALSFQDVSLSQVAVDVVTLSELQPILKPSALIGVKVMSDEGRVGKISGYQKEGDWVAYEVKLQRIVDGKMQEDEVGQEWTEQDIRAGLRDYKLTVA
eukprot:gene27267-33961_t